VPPCTAANHADRGRERRAALGRFLGQHPSELTWRSVTACCCDSNQRNGILCLALVRLLRRRLLLQRLLGGSKPLAMPPLTPFPRTRTSPPPLPPGVALGAEAHAWLHRPFEAAELCCGALQQLGPTV
jgi:hypothetical protein